MKIAFDSTYHWDFGAPTLQAEMHTDGDGVTRLRVFCPHCEVWHYHGPRLGHREAHCHDPASPFERTGYNLQMP
ncbi:MAG: hypothetical protein AAF802_00755 [Planctomycetota bacterium]